MGDTSKARIFYPDGRIVQYQNGSLALQIYYALPPGIKAAFRTAGNKTPVYPHDYVTY